MMDWSKRGRFLLVPLVLAACGRRAKEPLPAAEATMGDPTAVAVTVAPVVIRPVQRTVEAVGTLMGFEEVAISAKVEGRVRRILHDVADRVKPGETLLEVDATDYELSARQAERALQVEWARLGLSGPPSANFDFSQVPQVVQAKINLENARSHLERSQGLAAKQAATREELADKLAAFRIRQAEYDNQILMTKAGLATVQMKQEALAMAEQQLKDVAVRVPVPTQKAPGVDDVKYAITSREVAEGTFVRPGSQVFRLVIENPLKLRALVPERHASEVKLNQRAEVHAAARQKPFLGSVTRINPAVDPVNRTFEIEILVSNPNGEMKPGGFAKGVVLTKEDPKSACVPIEAVTRFAGVTKIFLAENEKAREVQVEIGVQGTDWVEIARPALPAAALVVTSGQSALFDGAPIVARTLEGRASLSKGAGLR